MDDSKNCQNPPQQPGLNLDEILGRCREQEVDAAMGGTINIVPIQDSLKTPISDLSWLEEAALKKKPVGGGQSANCDPMQAGHTINDVNPDKIDSGVVYRYSQCFRGTHAGVKDLFSNIIVEDDSRKVWPVPIIMATPERAIAYLLQDNIREGIVERLTLPMMSLQYRGYDFDHRRYVYHKAVDYIRDPKNKWRPSFTLQEGDKMAVFGLARGLPVNMKYALHVWTMHELDMLHIEEQIVSKFSKRAYIRVNGVSMEVGVLLNSVSDNSNWEPAENEERVFKTVYEMTVESYVSQPMVRRRPVLGIQTEIVNSTDFDDVSEVLERLETVVKDIQDD